MGNIKNGYLKKLVKYIKEKKLREAIIEASKTIKEKKEEISDLDSNNK